MANDKPQITATIKFRGVTIEGMTIQELRELRDVLNQIVGEPRVVEKHIHHDRYPYYPWRWEPTVISTTGTWTVDTNKLTCGVSANSGVLNVSDSANYMIRCN